MKKFYISCLMISLGSVACSQTLISYGSNNISKDEFLRAYNKNKTTVTDKEKALREYVDLYSNFKLKVRAAQELRLDTLPQIKNDIENFRNQIMETYLSDDKGLQKLIDEGFYRSGKDLHVLHFSIPVPENEDSSKALLAAKAVSLSLNSGVNDYAGMAKEMSDKYTQVKQTDMGYITAFTLPYQYETLLYNTKPGKATEPYRTKTSWHVFKVLNERPNPGRWKIAQVLFAFPPDATPELKESIGKKADEVYALLLKGDDFGSIAKQYSDDKITYLTGGELPEFTTGKYAADFEKEVFKLKTDGEFSKPFTTAFGYHIIKRIKLQPVITNSLDPTAMYEMKQKILQDARINIEREKFAQELLVKLGYKKTGLVKDADIFRYADSILKNPDLNRVKNFPISNKPIISFKNETLKGEDWLKYVSNYKTTPEQYNSEPASFLWDKFVRNAAVNNYKKNLELYNADFNFQMQEFREGNMLFEIMERNVWNKAFTDSVGLLKMYNSNKSNYKWSTSAAVVMVNAASATLANDVLEQMKNGVALKTIIEKHANEVQADSGRFELSQIAGAENMNQPGTYSEVKSNDDGTAYFVKFIQFYPANQPRSFEEARGLVINDYQNVLEQKWLAALKKKYPVKVNEVLLKQMYQ
ncbi:MAG: peptidylprolyl isomerase [Ferruginibacter sp.]